MLYSLSLLYCCPCSLEVGAASTKEDLTGDRDMTCPLFAQSQFCWVWPLLYIAGGKKSAVLQCIAVNNKAPLVLRTYFKLRV